MTHPPPPRRHTLSALLLCLPAALLAGCMAQATPRPPTASPPALPEPGEVSPRRPH